MRLEMHLTCNDKQPWLRYHVRVQCQCGWDVSVQDPLWWCSYGNRPSLVYLYRLYCIEASPTAIVNVHISATSGMVIVTTLVSQLPHNFVRLVVEAIVVIVLLVTIFYFLWSLRWLRSTTSTWPTFMSRGSPVPWGRLRTSNLTISVMISTFHNVMYVPPLLFFFVFAVAIVYFSSRFRSSLFVFIFIAIGLPFVWVLALLYNLFLHIP